MLRLVRPYRWICGVIGLGMALILALIALRSHGDVGIRPKKGDRQNASEAKDPSERRTRVQVVKPHKGGLQRTSEQPGSIEAFEFADLYGKVSGYLARQTVDIGDHVKAGQVLAEIAAPEYQEELDRAHAALAEARSQVKLTEAQVKTAQADL